MLAIKCLLEAALLEAAKCQQNHQDFTSPSGDRKGGGLKNGLEILETAGVPEAKGVPLSHRSKTGALITTSGCKRTKFFSEAKGNNLSTDKTVPQSVRHSSNQDTDNRVYNESRDYRIPQPIQSAAKSCCKAVLMLAYKHNQTCNALV